MTKKDDEDLENSIYNKLILENRGMLRFIPDCYKNQK